MRKILLAVLILCMVMPALFAKVTYLNEEEYKKLSKNERLSYWTELETELESLQQRKADAIANSEKYTNDIQKATKKISDIDLEYSQLRSEIFQSLGVNETNTSSVEKKLNYFNSLLKDWKNMSDSQIWENSKAIKELVAEYNEYKKTNSAKIPDFRQDFVELDRKISGLEQSLENARPKYSEDEYTVVKGDYLSKISGYKFIYNDPQKWGIIYRANRDQIKDPNILSIDQVLKIPRGLPNSWKVYRGECLWKIASYPEVYGNGSKWPLVYRENKDQIKDPNIIFPNQVFRIPRN